jgi:hypothetical protein
MKRLFLARMSAALIGLTLALMMAELGLRLAGSRLAGPRLPLTYDHRAIDDFASAQYRFILDRDLGWVTKPNVAFVAAEQPGVLYRHNDAGLRADRDYTRTAAAGIRRIEAYGDSFTYCEEVNLSDCWTWRVEETLTNTEVLNYGVPASAADQAWLRYQRNGSSGQSCAVLIGHTLENIVRLVNRFRPFMHPATSTPLAKPRFILEEDRLVLLANPAAEPQDLKDPLWVEANLGPHDFWYFPGLFVPNPFDRLELVRLARTIRYRTNRESANWTTTWAERMYRPGTETLDVLAAVLAQFAHEVRVNGATPIVLVFPTIHEIAGERDGLGKPHASLLKELKRHGVPTIDLSDALGREARGSGLETLISRGGHYSTKGNAAVARTLARQLPSLTAETCGRV